VGTKFYRKTPLPRASRQCIQIRDRRQSSSHRCYLHHLCIVAQDTNDRQASVGGENHNTILECKPMPNMMDDLPNIGGPSVQRHKVWLTPTTGVRCSNAAKTRNPLKLAGVPQTTRPISAASRPKFTILWDIWRRYCCLTSFFSDCQYVP